MIIIDMGRYDNHYSLTFADIHRYYVKAHLSGSFSAWSSETPFSGMFVGRMPTAVRKNQTNLQIHWIPWAIQTVRAGAGGASRCHMDHGWQSSPQRLCAVAWKSRESRSLCIQTTKMTILLVRRLRSWLNDFESVQQLRFYGYASCRFWVLWLTSATEAPGFPRQTLPTNCPSGKTSCRFGRFTFISRAILLCVSQAESTPSTVKRKRSSPDKVEHISVTASPSPTNSSCRARCLPSPS